MRDVNFDRYLFVEDGFLGICYLDCFIMAQMPTKFWRNKSRGKWGTDQREISVCELW